MKKKHHVVNSKVVCNAVLVNEKAMLKTKFLLM